MPVARRTLLAVGLTAAATTLAGCGDGPASPGDPAVAPDAVGDSAGLGRAEAGPGTPAASATPSGQSRYAATLTTLLRRHLPDTPRTVRHRAPARDPAAAIQAAPSVSRRTRLSSFPFGLRGSGSADRVTVSGTL